MAKQFTDMVENPPNNAMIVDALNLCFRWKHAGRSDYRYEFQKVVESLAQSYKAEKTIITADWGSSTYRKNLDENYKADRKERFKDQTPEEKVAFEEFFEEYEQTLKNMQKQGYVVLRYKGVEADDIAASLVLHRKQYELENIWLISSDRDWNLLVSEDVSQFSYVTRKEYTLANWSEHYDFPIEKYLDYKVICGDKGDNIQGFAQIGEKRAVDLISQYDSAFDIYDAIPIDSKYKFMVDLNENPDRIMLNYKLMDLLSHCDEAIGEGNISDIREQMGDIKW